MGRFFGWRALLVCGVASLFMLFGASGALADDFHGIAFAKQCTSPVKIGDPYTCSLQILNIVDTAHDTLRVTGFSDVVHSAGGNIATGNIMPSTGLVFTGAVTCSGGTGAGTLADPYIGATECLLPFNSAIVTKGFSHYTVQAADFGLPNNQLTDTATLNWNNTCTAPSPNCTTDAQANTAGSSADVLKLASGTATDIHNAAHAVVTAVAVGSTVHDFVTVTGQPGSPIPTGNVNVDWFLNGTCAGAPAANSGSVGPLDGAGHFDATGFAFTVNTASLRAFRAHYEGDATYLPSDGACEPLQVVDANIQITPPTATNRVSTNHVLTCHINVNDGTGTTNAPAGTTCTGAIVSGPGSFVGSNQCLTVGTTGDCQLTITSTTTGLTTIRASTNVTVAGVSLHRETGDGHAGDSADAQKLWVNAAIVIAPNATNRVGQPHTFTATLLFDTGSGLQPAGAGQSVTVTLIPSNGATPVPTGPFTGTTNGAGQFAVTFTSQATGTVAGHASWTGSVSGSAPFTVSTDGQSPNSADAVKTFVNARISIAQSATNEIGAPHTFTVTLEKDLGDGNGFVAAPGEHVDVTLTDSNGAVSVINAAASTCDDAGANTNGAGKCTITFTSNSAGKVTGHASSTLSVGGSASFTVQTDGQSPNGGDAVKTFVDANIQIAPNGVNRIGQTHTFTAHVNINTGNGLVNAPNGTQISFTKDSGPGSFTSANPCTTSGGTGSCTIDLSSDTTGVTTVSAHTTVTVGGVQLTRNTDSVAPNSVPATKRWVDAKIAISPDATNRIGQPHTFTVTLMKDTGNGSGFVAAAGEHVDVNLIDSAGGTHSAPTGTCTTAGGNTNASGQCTITFTSNATGQVTGHASSTLSVAGSAPFTVQTDASAPNSSDAVKTFVNAKISIAQSATNEVGAPHTFTVTLQKDLGNGAGFVAAPGEHVGFTLTDSSGAASVLNAAASTCDDAGANTNGLGQCTIVFTSNSAGTVTAHATSTLSVNGSAAFTVQTDGASPNGADAVKTFVDAYIEISPPAAANPINTTHTYKAHVFVDSGSGSFTDAPNGTVVTFAFVGTPVGTFSAGNQCTIGNGLGTCTIDTTSAKPGDDVMQASTTLAVGVPGVTLTRTTGTAAPGHANGPNANKNWVGAKITFSPDATNEIGQPHTFTVTLSKDTGTGYKPAAGEHVDVTLTDSNGASHLSPTGTCTGAGANTDASGQCTVTFTSNSAGKVTGHATATLPVDGKFVTVSTDGTGDNSVNAVKTFVDANVQIAPLADVNPIGTNHTLTGHVNVNKGDGNGFVAADPGTVITFSLQNSGGASAAFVGPSTCTVASGGSCTATISSPTTGTTTVKAATTVIVGGVSLSRATGDAKVGDSADASKLWADDTARTDILNSSGAVLTTAVAGTVVHDKVFVARTAGTPAGVSNPTGSVVFHRYATINCSGTAVNQTVALTAGNPSTAESDAFAVTADMSYQAEYLGDANYPARTGACEPLTVTPVPQPAIAIVKNPKSQTVLVGATATFSITVTNTGNTVLTDVHVDDPLSPLCNRTKADLPALASMAPGAAVTYTCTRPNVRSAFDNVATAIGTPPSGPDVTASDTAPVTAKAPLKPKVVKKKPKVVSHKKPKATG